MKERFQTILNLEKLSAAQLAAILGIQRSTLSNILGGRNNPSYEVIHGLLTKLPNLNIDWLLTGEGQPYRNLQKNFRGDVISKDKDGEQNSSENSESGEPENFDGNKSDLFGFEKADDDFPVDSDFTQPQNQQQPAPHSQQAQPQQAAQPARTAPVSAQPAANQSNKLSGATNDNIIARQEAQKKEREKQEMQAKMKMLQQIVNEKAAAEKHASQPSENRVNGATLTPAGETKELKKVILLYSDNSFDEYEKN
ncbi:MAG: helix-turn-helix domain-containing protein [Bacteroidales bacterium]|jgi:transcriptional regulator with XRE-family HTH domain|nr:helix-turn-helix domain-containing protein [Bacteroidales bacterium]MCI1733596.1 helix-turn-helix domain-containing protein [Bacteroidales bacterium]